MENRALIDETEDKAIPIMAQYFNGALKFHHPSKEQKSQNSNLEQGTMPTHKNTLQKNTHFKSIPNVQTV